MRNTPNTSRALCVVACRESRDVPRSRCGDNVVWCRNTPTVCRGLTLAGFRAFRVAYCSAGWTMSGPCG